MNGPRRGNNPAIQAVSFDVGGTLIQVWPSVGHVYAQVAGEHGWPGLSAEILNRRFAAAWKAQPLVTYSREEWAALVDAAFDGLITAQPSRTFFPSLYERFNQPGSWRIYDDVVPTLERLKSRGLRLAVISNWDERLRHLLGRLGLDSHFDEIVISCEAGDCKPSARIFEAAAARLQLPPAAILHVGDSLEMDARGARAAGLAALHLRRLPEVPDTGRAPVGEPVGAAVGDSAVPRRARLWSRPGSEAFLQIPSLFTLEDILLTSST